MKSLILVLLLTVAGPAFAQQDHDAHRRMADQKEKISKLDFLNGEWRGTAKMTQPDGKSIEITQTERVGPLLDGQVKLIEGRGYSADGVTQFNALGVLSWDPDKQAYQFRSYAMGQAGDFEFERTSDGFKWSIPAGPGATVEYVATIKGDSWHETGTYVRNGKPLNRFIEMNLKRIGDTSWPVANAVPSK